MLRWTSIKAVGLVGRRSSLHIMHKLYRRFEKACGSCRQPANRPRIRPSTCLQIWPIDGPHPHGRRRCLHLLHPATACYATNSWFSIEPSLGAKRPPTLSQRYILDAREYCNRKYLFLLVREYSGHLLLAARAGLLPGHRVSAPGCNPVNFVGESSRGCLP